MRKKSREIHLSRRCSVGKSENTRICTSTRGPIVIGATLGREESPDSSRSTTTSTDLSLFSTTNSGAEKQQEEEEEAQGDNRMAANSGARSNTYSSDYAVSSSSSPSCAFLPNLSKRSLERSAKSLLKDLSAFSSGSPGRRIEGKCDRIIGVMISGWVKC